MRRREFITLLGGAAAAWPLAARAQQPERDAAHRRADRYAPKATLDWRASIAAFRKGLQELGLDRRPQRADRLSLGCGQCRAPARLWQAELVGLGAGCSSLATGTPALAALQRSDRLSADRVCAGRRSGRRRALSRAWRGRAATSPGSPISNRAMGGKWLEIAQGDCARASTRVGILV